MMMMVMMRMRVRVMTRMTRMVRLIMGMRWRMMVMRMVITWINHPRSSSPSFRTGRLRNISSDSLQ